MKLNNKITLEQPKQCIIFKMHIKLLLKFPCVSRYFEFDVKGCVTEVTFLKLRGKLRYHIFVNYLYLSGIF